MRVISLLSVLVLLSGCSLKEPLTVSKNVYLSITCPNPPNVRVISTAPVRPQAIKDVAGVYWVGLTPKDYENLALNVQESIRFIKGQKGQLNYYKSCIIDFNDTLKRKPDN